MSSGYISAAFDRDRDSVIVWERDEDGERISRFYDAPYYFYYSDDEGRYTTIYDTKVSKVVSKTGREHYSKRKAMREEGIELWESDIHPIMRTLANQYYNKPSPTLNVTFLDIEVDYDPDIGFSSPRNPYAPINSISMFHTHRNEMVLIAIPPDDGIPWTPELLIAAMNDIEELPDDYTTTVRLYETERELLEDMLQELADSDVLCGWNSEMFDFPYIGVRVGRVLGKSALKRLSFPSAPGSEPTIFEEVVTQYGEQIKLHTTGRILADYMHLYKKYEPGERHSFSLSAIEEEVGLNLPKLHYEGSLADLYVNDFALFARYNFRDSEILRGFENTLGYVEVSNQMYHMSCGLFEHVLGTIKLAELAITNFCHFELQRVVNDIKEPEIDKSIDGALVLLPQVGMHEMVSSVDITSLYPSVIRSINISPETMIGQMTGDVADFEAILEGSDKLVTLIVRNGKDVILPAVEFREWLKERKYAVSGYGTVYDQNRPGIIPSILAGWFASRKDFQRQLRDARGKADQILVDFKDTGNVKRGKTSLSREHAKAYDDLIRQVGYFDRIQYIYKIKLNSLYGALTNLYFRFYGIEHGESTTATGRAILRHQCRTTGLLLDGSYDFDVPQYATVQEAIDRGLSPNVALNGPRFNGKFMSESVVYGDTDSVVGTTEVDLDGIGMEIELHFERLLKTGEGSLIQLPNNVELMMLDGLIETPCIADIEWDYRPVSYIYRHKTNKPIYRVSTSNGKFVDMTADHSAIVVRDGMLVEVKPTELHVGDEMLSMDGGRIVPCFVVSVEGDGQTISNQWVYDVAMEDESRPYFFGNDILVHNSVYFKTHAKTADEAILIGDAVAEEINKSYPDFMRRAFMCSEGFDEIIKCEREVVSDRGIFVGKKLYILHLVDVEGKTVDKMKVMGLSIKKTTLPREITDVIEKFIERLLKGEGWASISESIVDFKDTIHNPSDIRDIGLPRGINGLEDYTTAFEADYDTRLPGHVAASILYNNMLKEYNDKASPAITSGTKIKVFYLKRPYGRFKSIALPTDIEIVPKWFLEDFDINTDAHVSRLVDRPLENIVKAIGYTSPSRQSLLADDLLVF